MVFEFIVHYGDSWGYYWPSLVFFYLFRRQDFCYDHIMSQAEKVNYSE